MVLGTLSRSWVPPLSDGIACANTRAKKDGSWVFPLVLFCFPWTVCFFSSPERRNLFDLGKFRRNIIQLVAWSPVDLPRLCMCCWCHLPDLSQQKDVYHGKFKRLQRSPSPKKKVSTTLPTWKLCILFLVRTKSCIIWYARNVWVVKILSIRGTTALRTAVGTSLWDRVTELVEDEKLLIRQDYW